MTENVEKRMQSRETLKKFDNINRYLPVADPENQREDCDLSEEAMIIVKKTTFEAYLRQYNRFFFVSAKEKRKNSREKTITGSLCYWIHH